VDHQCGFRHNRSNAFHIICIRQILEKKWEYNVAKQQQFIDFKMTYDSFRSKVFCNRLIEFGIPMTMVSLIKMCLNERYSRVRVAKHESGVFSVKNSLKQGDGLSLFLLNVALGYAVRKVQVNQDALNLNNTHEFLVYAVAYNILGGSVHTI